MTEQKNQCQGLHGIAEAFTCGENAICQVYGLSLVFPFTGRNSKKNKLAQKTQKSLKKEFTIVVTNCPGKGRIPLLKSIFFPGIELHP